MLNSHVQRSYRNKRSACERPLCVRNFHCFRQRIILLLTALLHIWHRIPFLEVLTRLNLLVSKVVEFCQYNKVKLFEMYSLCLSPPCDESRGIMLVYLVVWDVYCKEIMTSSTARVVMLNNCPNKVGKCRKCINITVDIKVCVSSFRSFSLFLGRVWIGLEGDVWD